MNLALILENHARRRPDHPAILGPDQQIDYRGLNERVQRTAAHLIRSGAHKRAIVGVCLRDTVEHLIALYAIALVGAVAFPMDWRWTTQEKERLIRFFKPALILAEPDSPSLSVHTLCVDQHWSEAVARASPHRPDPPHKDGPLVLALSSGTTGTPKGPLLNHTHMLARFQVYFLSFGFSEIDRYLCATPLYFGGSRGLAMCTLFAGGTVVLFPLPYDVSAIVEAVHQHQATRLFLVPTLLRRLLRLPAKEKPLFDQLRLLLSTGAPLHPEERSELLDRICKRYMNFYGSTDGGGATVLRPEDSGSVERSVGRPVFGAWVEVVDDDHAPLPPGVVGRIRYRNEGTVTAYYKNPEASARAFHDGWYYPGDLGRIDDRGYLYLAGRESDLIIRGGINIYPAEIEAILLEHPAVNEAAVLGWPSREYGEEVAAFVVLSDESEIDENSLISHCRYALASYKVPKEIFFVRELPRSSSGKVLKSKLAGHLHALD